MRWNFLRRKARPIEQLQESLSMLRHAAEFVPTPWGVARRMLELASAGPEDIVYDLGSGDGRIPILAAQEFGCRAMGIEKDGELCQYSQQKVADLGLHDQVKFQRGDFFQADLRTATVVTLYLLSAVNGQLQSRLASHLRPGSRVVALDFEIPGWRPVRTTKVRSDGNVEYTLFLYLRPSLPFIAERGREETRL
ncbi:MAG: SAM-dependent methyltransferase [Candidatus Acidiferrales bacterium]